jgi:hypothetical protein
MTTGRDRRAPRNDGEVRKALPRATPLGDAEYPTDFAAFFVPGRHPLGIVAHAKGRVGIKVYSMCEFVSIDVA